MKRTRLETRTPLERHTPLERGGEWGRKGPFRAKRPRRLDREDYEKLVNDFDGTGPRLVVVEGHDEVRLDWCREQACVVCGREPTDEFPSQACHEGRTGKGMATKCPDSETFPMCAKCHREWTLGASTNGFCRTWSKERRRDWAFDQHTAAHARFLSAGSRRAA